MASNVDIKSLLQQSHEQAQRNLASQVADNRDSGSNKRYSDVNDTYISTFLRDADGFFSRETQNYNEMTYSGAISQQGKQERYDNWNDLSYRAGLIKNYILENRGSLEWNDSWQELLDYTSNFDQSVRAMNTDFENKYKYVSQFESENDYNWYEKYNGNNSDDLKAMMDELEDGDEKTWLDAYTRQVYNDELKNLDVNAARAKVAGMEELLNTYRTNSRMVSDVNGQAWWEELQPKLLEYGGVEGLEQAISRENQRIQLATRVQEQIRNQSRFQAVTGNADFAEKSVFDPSNTEIGYRYINGDAWDRFLLEDQYGQYAEEFGYHAYDSLTDEEKAVYNYFMNTGDRESAADYLRHIQDPINQRKAQAIFEDGFKGHAGREFVYGWDAGLDQFRSGAAGFGAMIRGDTAQSTPSATQYASAMMREDLGENGKKLPEWLGGGTVGQAVYDSVTTTANMAPSILASTVLSMVNPAAGAWVGSAMMGASAAGSAYQEMIDSGYSTSQARIYGSLVGAAEIVLDKILGGITDLGSGSSLASAITRWAGNVDNALVNLVGRIGGNAMSEGAEEALQEVFSGWLKSEVTKEDFYAKPADVIYSGLLGAVTGALFESPEAGIDVYQRISQGQNVIRSGGVQTLTDMGKASGNTDIRRMAERTARKPSAYNVGGLSRQVSSDIHSQNVADISEQLAGNGMKGKDANQMAEVIASVLENGSESDIRLLASETDPIVAKTMRQVQMKGTALSQRMQQLRGATGKSRSISQVAAQYGSQSEAVKAAYIPGQDVNTFAHDFERAHILGREGGKAEALEQVAPDLAASQRKIAYDMGRAAAAEEKAAVTKQMTGEVSAVYRLNEDGSTGDAVRIEGVTSKEGGQWTYKTSDGQELTEDQLSFSGDHAVLDTVKALDLDAKTASVLISGNNTISKPDSAVAQGIEDAYRYGSHGYSMERLLKDSEAAGILTEEMRQAAYDAGKNKPAKSKPSKAKPKTRGTKPGVYFDNGNGQVQAYDLKSTRQLEDTKKAGVQTAVVLQKLGIGTDFYFFESYVKDGKRVYRDEKGVERPAPNGWYDPNDGSIHIDLNAGNGGQGLTLYTMAHELTHFIEQWSQEKYKVLADFLIKTYEKGRSVDDLVHLKQQTLSEERGKPVSYEEAYSEVIADSMEAMLSDGNVLEKLAELKAKDEGLVRKMKAFFDNFVKKIRSIYADLKPESAEGQLVQEMNEQFEQLQQLFAEALADAGENYRNAAEVGMEVDVDTESVAPMVQMSERTWRESDYVQARNEAAREISKAIGVTEDKARSYIDDVNSIAKMIAEDRTRLDYFSSPGRSSFIGNVEYGGSFDFSTLCKKRRLLTGTFTAIQRALPNTALTANEILDIRNRMKKAGLEVSCGLCYVEGSRANMAQFAQEFLKLYKQYYPDAWQPNMADVNTPEGIEWVRINHPECYEQYEYFWNHYGTLKPGDKNLFASQQKPKLYQLHTEYNGEILQKFKNDDNVEDKNLNGGIRLQSFSDFEIVHLIDTMQIIMDMSRVGLAGQAYTKVPDFAWALGDTGLKINLSLIAKDVDAEGKLIFDDIEGMPIAEAMRLRSRYSSNVGTILVVFNDAQLMAAMADDRVDFIIPFHRSQWKKNQYEAMGLPARTKDYTYMQNEKFIKPQYHEYRGRLVRDKATNYMPNEYWDFSKSGKENAVAYLEMCARNNKRPKFYKLLQNNGDGSFSLKADGSTDGYWKLLIDFKMYDNDGNGSPQTPVRPEFNMDEATRMLNDYRGGHSNFPVAQGIVDDFVSEYKDNHGNRMYSDRKKAVDNSYIQEDNVIRGENYEDRRIRKGTEADTTGSGYDGRTDSGSAGNAPQAAEWRSLDGGVKRKVRSVIKQHLNNSPNINEALSVIYSFVGRTDETITPYSDRKAMEILADKLYTASMNDHPVIFESNWAFMGGNVSDLQKNIRSATGDDSIVKQDRPSAPITNRALLANALESTTQDETELTRLREYRMSIDYLNEQEAKLTELRSQIREISFGKGPRDTARLKQLQEEATKTANRINVADKKLLRLEAAQPLQRVLERERGKAYRQAQDRNKEVLARRQEGRNKTAVRHKIQRVVNELNKLLLNGDKKNHVPENLKKAVADALALVNMDTVGLEERIAKYRDLIANETDPDKIDAYTVTMENLQRKGEQMGQRLKDLRDAYEEFQKSDDPDIANAYDPVIAGSLQELAGSIGNTALKDMSMEQLQDVYDMYTMVLTRVRDSNKSFQAARNQSIAERSAGVVREIRAVGGDHKMRAAILDPVRKFFWNNLKPVYAFETIGSGTLQEAFNAVRKGEDVWAVDVSEARNFYLERAKKYGYNSWDFKKKYRFESESGQSFELTLEQILSLYAYSRRAQAHEHLRLGGFVFDSNIETYKEKGSKLVKYKVNTAEAHQIDPETLTEIIGTLSKDQIAFVEDMQGYLSNTMGAKGNEVTMQMYGVKLFREKNYFPLKSAKQFMFEQNEVSGEVKLKNSGFTNKLVAKANNPVILSNFMDVWAGHVNDMSMYHAFVLPLEDFNRIFNYNSPKKENIPSVSVKGTLQNAYGPASVSYVKELITDLNGGARTDSTTGPINKLMGMFKKGAVFASASVVVQQPSAVARAAAVMDLKWFVGGKIDRKRHDQLWEEVKRYAPVAVIKEMGYFDTNMGKSSLDYITGREYDGFWEKAKATITDSDFRDELLSRAPAYADEVAWCAIWDAVKRETRSKNPGMDTKSDIFLNKAGDRFTEVITKTQVYDSVLARSANMRSKDTGMKMATAFMAEPTTSINMVADALLKGKRGDKATSRKVIGAVVASQILNAFLVAWVYAARDDDDEKTYWEKYVTSFLSSVMDGVNPLTYIPFIKDIVSIVQGYDVERSDMAVISDLWNAWQQLQKDNVSAWRKVEGFVGSICQIFGLPLKNIMRDVRAIWQTYDTFVNGESGTDTGMKYAIAEGVTGGSVSNPMQLYYARRDGDTEHATRVAGRYDDEDSADAAVRSAIRELYLSGELDLVTARNHLVTYGGMKVDEAHWTMDEWKYRKEMGTDDGYGKYNAFHEAVRTGENLEDTIKSYTENGVSKDTLRRQITETFKPEYVKAPSQDRERLYENLMAAYQACGMDPEEAEDKLWEWEFEAEYGFTWSDRKQAYWDGKVTGPELQEILIDIGDYEPDMAAAQVEAYDWEAEGLEGATPTRVKEYNLYCKSTRLSRETYLAVMVFSAKTENDVDEEGNTIKYSAVEKIMAEMVRLGLTLEQKEAMVLCFGWGKNTIKHITRNNLW